MAAEDQRLRAHRSGRARWSWPGRPTRRWRAARSKGSLHGVPLAHKDMYYFAGQGRGLRLESARRLDRARDLDRDRAAGSRRRDPHRRTAYGGIRLRPDRAQRLSRPCAQSVESRPHHRRFVVRLGRRGGGAARTYGGARLGHRRLDPPAGAFLRRHRPQDRPRPGEPRQCDAAVVHARHGRAAGAQRRRIAR